MIGAKEQLQLIPVFMRWLKKTKTEDRVSLQGFKTDIDCIIEAAFEELKEENYEDR